MRFVVIIIGSLKSAAHAWYSGRHDPPGSHCWLCRVLFHSPAVSNAAAQEERCQISSCQHCTQRRLMTKLLCAFTVPDNALSTVFSSYKIHLAIVVCTEICDRLKILNCDLYGIS